jgi:hypothetical protein
MAAGTQGAFNLLPQVGVIDDDVGETCGGQPFQMPGNEGLAAYSEKGLGGMVGQGAHALASACG